ncbi:RsmE family RNA methyltransferase [Spiroplasma platyhelix]|uniref:Ribosomal RNA small subunit methyltransferase E n=1 Tax=Spiroplasma platyhelix PALS-1 TaxID=1276218 RepID=A0A846TVV4_9MOLU|nr:RsmE family RNA methyltransferase [Spiroplasma platyhelix]MBE4703909.1 Ribosomal RNA small subunit methyltransferase E [Spiroplasma platyhelix PALS-1]NKE38282.1 16S rRNA (uracil(1498)-N(3))-methyltransferase [Spiroplasma platyhelix PALS-1]UJB29167.1 16S ribosomal RNA methyltransferase RsmE [Spiroplasma platyhelix PALS-1]
MECYFADSSNSNQQLVLDQEDTTHIIKVLRHKIGDEVVVVFQGKKYRTKIVSLTPFVVCQIIEPLESDSELPIKITLVMALLKEQKFDLVIQKAVELGVHQIVPVQLERSISVVSNLNTSKLTSKVARWQKIARAAAKQSNRNIIPEIMPIISSISDLKKYQSEVNFLAYENAAIANWEPNLKQKQSVTIVVGPEGGISEKELKSFAALKFTNISLGRTILRAETAPLYFLSVVNYYSAIKN